MSETVSVAGVAIPKLGLGTYALHDQNCAAAVADGIAAGFRHVDTAEMYQNEAAVGEGVRGSGVPREAVFLTTKVWHDHLSDGLLQAAVEASLSRLRFDYVDLCLIHWPNASVPLEETIGALNTVHARGLARAVGVSNFPIAQLDRAVALSEAPLAVNQVEYHPFLDQGPLLSAVRGHGMGLTAYCPLARGKVLQNETIGAIAAAHGVSNAAVTLAWLIAQDGVIAIPKSGSRARLGDNLSAYELTLSEEERAAIDALRRPDGRMVDPEFAPEWDLAA